VKFAAERALGARTVAGKEHTVDGIDSRLLSR